MRKNQKASLTKDKIIAKGLELVAEQGVPAVSFRKLADKLKVTPMALYRYFENKEDLLGELLDQFIRDANVLPENTLSWDEWLKYVSEKMYLALRDEPSWIPVFSHIQLKPSALEVMDNCMGVLLENGFTKTDAVKAFLGMIHCMLGASLMYTNMQADSNLNVSNLKMESYPNITASLSELFALTQQDQMTTGIDLLIAGLQQ